MHIKNWKPRKAITKKDIMKKEIHDEVISQIQLAYDNSQAATDKKRKYHMNIDRKVKKLHEDDRLNYDLLHSYKKSFIAMFQDEGMYPIFQEKEYSDQEITDVLNKFAKEDMHNMNKGIKDQKMLWDIFDYGVWLRVYNGYNKELWSPEYITPSPMSWYPDPAGNALDNDFDYHMFYTETSISDLEYMNIVTWWYINLDSVMPNSDDQDNNDQRQKQYRLQNTEYVDMWVVWVYNCFITINWYRYFCVVANNRGIIIKREPLEPKTKKEKDDPTLVPFKVSISHAQADLYDPRGISYREKVYPVQVALKQVTNAIHNKELRNLWFGIQFYDQKRLENSSYLQEKPQDWPIFVPVDDLSDWPIVTSYGDTEVTQWSQQYMKALEYYAENTTSLTWITRWLTPDAWTLWETEIQMQKSNALFSVDAQSLNRWEQMFWKAIWFRSLQENLNNQTKKTMIVWEDSKNMLEIAAKDINKYGNPYIKIMSKRKENERNIKRVTSMKAYLPLLMQDPNAPEITKKIFKREMMRLEWLDHEFIMAIEWLTPSERHAKEMVEIINQDMKPKKLIKPWVDLQTLWIYLQKARDTKEKEIAINALNIMMIDKGIDKPKEIDKSMQGVANSMASQWMSADIAQGQNNLSPTQWWSPLM